MDYYIQLTVETPQAVKFFGRDVFRIRVTASGGVNLPNEIFLHKRTLVDPNTSYQADEFIAICGPWDLATYPVDEPEPTQDPPFFRKAAFDILTPNVSSADETIVSVQKQVEFLLSTLKQLDKLEVVQSMWIPGEPPSGTTTTPAP